MTFKDMCKEKPKECNKKEFYKCKFHINKPTGRLMTEQELEAFRNVNRLFGNDLKDTRVSESWCKFNNKRCSDNLREEKK